MAGISLADVDLDALKPAERQAFEWAKAHAIDGFTYDELAARAGLTGRDVEHAIEGLGFRLKAQLPPVLPDLSAEEYEALKESIAEDGQQMPILTNLAGRIFDGKNRERVCNELGLEPLYKLSSLPDDQLERLALVLNIARRQLTTGARRGLVAVELVRDPSRSDRLIARTLGVSRWFVAKVRTELEENGQLAGPASRTGADGRTRPLPTPKPAVAPSAEKSEQLKERIERLAASQIRMGTVRIVSDGDSARVLAVPDDGGDPIEIPIIAGLFTVSAGGMAEASFRVLRPAAALISDEISIESDGLYAGTLVRDVANDQGVRFRRVTWTREGETELLQIDRVP